ncbi:hypothetical protein FA95DRAFT_1609523 [Auriscalpium vulgare]|uniref:Uncharacterized protein n=1 Tax=Auriscalpium vulgare TaxID=40419 RepID=A0ACB8RI35_9AGAM|nr:hypothetical protein FA95DRAFT_1609523 [Auriscalpium vulgare]
MLHRALAVQQRRFDLRYPPELNVLLVDFLSARHFSSSHWRPAPRALRRSYEDDEVDTKSAGEGDARRSQRRMLADVGDSTDTRIVHPNATPTRSLKPIIFSPTFAASPDLPLPEHAPSPSQQHALPPRDAVPVISIANLPPGTSKADLRPVFLPFGPIKSIDFDTSHVNAELTFVDPRSAANLLRAYADRPIRLHSRELIMFRKVGGAELHVEEAESIGDGVRAALSVTGLALGTTPDDLQDAFEKFGHFERVVIEPGAHQATVVFSSSDSVTAALAAQEHVPFVVRGVHLSAERADTVPELDVLQDVPGFRKTHPPSPVLWINNLPITMRDGVLSRFFSRIAPVVDVRFSYYGYAHVEFPSVEDAERVLQAAEGRGFRYRNRLLNIDFARRSHTRREEIALYIYGWKFGWTTRQLLDWMDLRNGRRGLFILPPPQFGPQDTPVAVYARFDAPGHALAAHRLLDGKPGPDGEPLRTVVAARPLLTQTEYEELAADDEEAIERDGLGFGALGMGWGALENGLWVNQPKKMQYERVEQDRDRERRADRQASDGRWRGGHRDVGENNEDELQWGKRRPLREYDAPDVDVVERRSRRGWEEYDLDYQRARGREGDGYGLKGGPGRRYEEEEEPDRADRVPAPEPKFGATRQSLNAGYLDEDAGLANEARRAANSRYKVSETVAKTRSESAVGRFQKMAMPRAELRELPDTPTRKLGRQGAQDGSRKKASFGLKR